MRIESIAVENFKVLQSFEMTAIPPLCVIVGANGAGKTTLFDVFGFLQDCLMTTVGKAIAGRGGFRRLVTQGHQREAITIQIQFRMDIANVNRLVTYRLEICERDGKPAIQRELLRYKRGRYGSPFHFLDFAFGRGLAVTNEEDFQLPDEQLTTEEQALGSNDTLAIKGLGQFERFKAASAFRQLIENWHVSDFFINTARGDKPATGFDQHLTTTGDNLANYIKYLHNQHPDRFQEMVRRLTRRVPGVDRIEATETEDGRLVLRLGDAAFQEPFIDRFVSDGTIKMLAYLALLQDPSPHPLLCVEEPENQLYPSLLPELAEEFRDYAREGGQVFVSTHSPDFLNACALDEVFWLTKRDGVAQVMRARDDDQIAAYVETGEDKLGSLWREGWFKDAHP